MGFACTGLTAAELMGEIKWMKKLLCGAFCSLEMQFFDVSLAVFVLSHAVLSFVFEYLFDLQPRMVLHSSATL